MKNKVFASVICSLIALRTQQTLAMDIHYSAKKSYPNIYTTLKPLNIVPLKKRKYIVQHTNHFKYLKARSKENYSNVLIARKPANIQEQKNYITHLKLRSQ